MKISAYQIDQASLALVIQQNASGASFSGNLVSYVAGSGWLGNNVVYTTGGLQLITGTKIFLDSPVVPYSGGTGRASSAGWVNDQIAYTSGWANGTYATPVMISAASGQLATNLALTGSGLYTLIVNGSGQASTDYATKTQLTNTGAALIARAAFVTVTGSSVITGANLSGIGGAQIIWSGNQILFSGGAGGGGGSTFQVTGSSAISAPNLTGDGNVTVSYDGTYIHVSGTASAGGVPNTVTTTGTYILAGGYTFSGSPFVPNPTQPSGAANLLWTSGVSGVLAARDSAISGALQTLINAASPTTNNYTFSGITGNFVNMAYWFDAGNIATGLNTIEVMVGRSFFFTGYGIGVINSGTQGSFSGSLYQRTTANTKTNFLDISLAAGVVFKASGGYNQTISGLNRVGLDIFSLGTGITGLSIGVFGVGY